MSEDEYTKAAKHVAIEVDYDVMINKYIAHCPDYGITATGAQGKDAVRLCREKVAAELKRLEILSATPPVDAFAEYVSDLLDDMPKGMFVLELTDVPPGFRMRWYTEEPADETYLPGHLAAASHLVHSLLYHQDPDTH